MSRTASNKPKRLASVALSIVTVNSLQDFYMSICQRRTVFGGLVGISIVLLLAIMGYTFSVDGINFPEAVFMTCFAVTLPWTTIGFWNAVAGFVLMRGSDDPAGHVFPQSREITGSEPITTSTALAMCIRNEDVDQVHRNISAIMARLCASGYADRFHVYILSDSYMPDIVREEEAVFERLRLEWAGRMPVTYRRRESNPGFKAGNIRDFCERWGHQHDFMLTLDADSVMAGSSILKLVRIMQKHGELGIVQSLAVGLPSASAFARVFQFGMRMGMRSFTLGSAWWQADCGPYWGHNALIRMKPFMEYCHLPKLEGNGPLSGWILSHDQVEAVYMRRAGYECRVLAEETGSFEENPPHILEFIRRDLRWCHGNMQYFRLLAEPGLRFMSRVQLLLAILMFIGAPAWMLLVTIGTTAFVFPDIISFSMKPLGSAYLLFGIVMTMVFAPKISSLLDVLLNPRSRREFGGAPAIILGAAVEVVFSMMLAPIMAVANTIFLVKLFVFRKAKGWVQQSRHAHSLPLRTTAMHLWPQTLFGLVGLTAVFSVDNFSYGWFLFAAPVFIGPAFAIPFAVSSSFTPLGRFAARHGLWQLPEEEMPPVIVRALDLPAITARGEAEQFNEAYRPLSTEQLIDMDLEFDTVRRA